MSTPAQTRIVLIETSHPGNIGAAARAMKTMGLFELALVNPQHFPNAEASARASGADDLLARAQVYDNLADALAGCQLVIGTSARPRELEWPMLNPEQSAEKAVSHQGQCALVFGRERSGLSNAELDLCHYLVQIPSIEGFSSLNLGAAVQIIAYSLRVAQLKHTAQMPDLSHAPNLADAKAMQYFYEHLEQTLIDIDFLDPEQPKRLMRRLRRLFNRAQPDETELNILRGILSASQKQHRPR